MFKLDGSMTASESDNHVIVGTVSIWDVKEPLRVRTTSTLAVTIITASIERPAWRRCSEKD